MFRNLYVISLLCVFLFLSCKNKEQGVVIAKISSSISGLLETQDTLMTYDLGLKKLSDYGFFKAPLKALKPASESVIPYELNSPLFTDYASKKRFIVLPEEAQIKYTDSGALDFPNGTILIKNFYYKDEELATENCDIVLETRLLIKDVNTGEWSTLPYVWNKEQTEAYLYILGKDIDVVINKSERTDKTVSFTYSVPNINMCKNCHVKDQKLVPLGPSARQLNRYNMINNQNVNQLHYFIAQKKIEGLKNMEHVHKMPNYLDETSGSLTERARAYLDVNCAHCHQKGGSAETSGLSLNYLEKNEFRFGVNKAPVAAGKGSGNLLFDIVKGKPKESILVYRMSHLEPEIMMPEIGKSLVHKEGLELVEAWITSLK